MNKKKQASYLACFLFMLIRLYLFIGDLFNIVVNFKQYNQ